MKKVFISIISLVLLFGFITVNSYAQSSLNEQRLVGTWILGWVDLALREKIWVFNANGTFTVNGEPLRWFTNAYKLVFIDEFDQVEWYVDFFLSPDGRTLVLVDEDQDGYVLRKR